MFADRALTYIRSADRAHTFRGHGMDDTRLAAQQFTEIRNGIPRNLSDFRKLLVTCTVFLVAYLGQGYRGQGWSKLVYLVNL